MKPIQTCFPIPSILQQRFSDIHVVNAVNLDNYRSSYSLSKRKTFRFPCKATCVLFISSKEN